MQIKLASITVDDQEKALRFYTTILGFVKKTDIPMGPFRWLTVSSPEGVEGVELVLEPMGIAPAQTYQQALFAAGIPATAFIAKDIHAEYRHLKSPRRQVSQRTKEYGAHHFRAVRGHLRQPHQSGSARRLARKLG
jgi:catechol 2,3-dioxygenase-like lactoylglutathione lyase family enzyme